MTVKLRKCGICDSWNGSFRKHCQVCGCGALRIFHNKYLYFNPTTNRQVVKSLSWRNNVGNHLLDIARILAAD